MRMVRERLARSSPELLGDMGVSMILTSEMAINVARFDDHAQEQDAEQAPRGNFSPPCRNSSLLPVRSPIEYGAFVKR